MKNDKHLLKFGIIMLCCSIISTSSFAKSKEVEMNTPHSQPNSSQPHLNEFVKKSCNIPCDPNKFICVSCL